MKFNLENHQVALRHVVLQDEDLAMEIADTALWKEQGIFEAKLIINGVEIPAEVIEDTLQKLYSHCERFYEEKYDVSNFDDRVEERAKELLQEHADNALDRINRLAELLNDPSMLLVPHWERKSK